MWTVATMQGPIEAGLSLQYAGCTKLAAYFWPTFEPV